MNAASANLSQDPDPMVTALPTPPRNVPTGGHRRPEAATPGLTVPAEAVEAAARAGWEADRAPDEPHWDDLNPHDRDSHRSYARLILQAGAPHIAAAALAAHHPTQTEPGS